MADIPSTGYISTNPDDIPTREEEILMQIEDITDPAGEYAQIRELWERMRGTLDTEYATPTQAWGGATKPQTAKAKRFFEDAPESRLLYGPLLYSDQPNYTDVTIGALAYRVNREGVVSIFNRLTEVGNLRILRKSFVIERMKKKEAGESVDSIDDALEAIDLVIDLQEIYGTEFSPGTQTIIYENAEVPYEDFEGSIIKALEHGEVTKRSKPNSKKSRLTDYEMSIRIPREASWEKTTKQEHEIKISFTAREPKEGRKNLITWLLYLFQSIDGRPAQHYQDVAAAIIQLEELIFAKGNSIQITIDGQEVKPDKLLGINLVLLLSQTAGGIFERTFYQTTDESGAVEFYQLGEEESLIQPKTYIHPFEEEGETFREMIVEFPSSPYYSRYLEHERALRDGSKVYELTELTIRTPEGLLENSSEQDDIMTLHFNTGNGRGIRDLSYDVRETQGGRFLFEINGREGFGYGEFSVSPTKEIKGVGYRTTITLRPEFSPDLANKVILIHVTHTPEGVLTETQVVPLRVVVPEKPVFDDAGNFIERKQGAEPVVAPFSDDIDIIEEKLDYSIVERETLSLGKYGSVPLVFVQKTGIDETLLIARYDESLRIEVQEKKLGRSCAKGRLKRRIKKEIKDEMKALR